MRTWETLHNWTEASQLKEEKGSGKCLNILNIFSQICGSFGLAKNWIGGGRGGERGGGSDIP